jgi:hypothetical protein
MVSELWCSFFFDSREQVWVITNLSELDQNVFVVTCRGPLIDGTFLEKLSIDALLGFSDTHLDVHFNLGHKTLLYLSLKPYLQDQTIHQNHQKRRKFQGARSSIVTRARASCSGVGYQSIVACFWSATV